MTSDSDLFENTFSTPTENLELPNEYSFNFADMIEKSKDYEFALYMIERYNLAHWCSIDKPISISTFISIILSIYKVCFNYLLLDCTLEEASKNCIDAFSHKGVFLLFTLEQRKRLLHAAVTECYKTLKRRLDIEYIQRIIDNISV